MGLFWQDNEYAKFVCLEFFVQLKNFSLTIAGEGLQILT